MGRLLIGSYILDEADSGSTSTTSGAQLDIGEAGDPDFLTPEILDDANGGGASEYRWPIMYVVVTAASVAALKTAVDAVELAILNCSGKTITFESVAGTTLFEMTSGTFPQATGSVSKRTDDLTCEMAFSFIGRRAGTPASGAASEPGQVGPITWNYEISGGGLAGMVARATFVANGTGARANAVTWINKLRNTANYPAWLGTAHRMISAVVEFDQKANEASLSETSYDPAQVTLTFRELAATLAADSNWPATVLAANWKVDMTPRPALNRRAGSGTGHDLTLFGDLTLKTEGNTAFNASETSLADGAIYAAANTAVTAIISQMRAVYASLALIQWGEPVLNIDEVQGIVGFAVHFTAGTTILQWEETCIVKNIFKKEWTRVSNGADYEWEQKGGPVRVCSHTLKIVATSPQPYKPPLLNRNWSEVDVGQEPTMEMKHTNGAIEYHTTGEKTWRYVNSSANDGRGATTALGPLSIDAIGNGVL